MTSTMKKKASILVLFIYQIVISQSAVTKNVGDFNKITSFDKIEVILIPSQENKVVLTGNLANEVEIINKNEELKIRLPLVKMLKGDATIATVYYKQLIAVEANEGSKISGKEIVRAINFEIIGKEGSEIKLFLETSRVAVRAVAGARLFLEGKAQNIDAVISAGSELMAGNLITNTAIITANAGGEATIYATDFVDAKVRAGGTITIKGKPKQINKKTIAGGSITEE